MLFHKIGIISIINYFCELVTVMLNEGLLSLKKKIKERCLLIINCFVVVTKNKHYPTLGYVALSLYLDNF